MPKFVELPDVDQLVRDLTDMLEVLNLPTNVNPRFSSGGGACVVPRDQLKDRARNIAQYLLCREVRP